MTQREANIVNQERQRAAAAIIAALNKEGVTITHDQFTGDSSYPTEWSIDFHGVKGMGPTFEMALCYWITALLNRTYNLVSSYREIETAMQIMAGSITNMRTELLVIKSMVEERNHE